MSVEPLSDGEELVSLIQATYFEHREGSLGTAIEAAAAILNAGWISPGQYAQLVATNTELVAVADKLNRAYDSARRRADAPCIECGHS